jgi:uncharacterized membrane protein
MPATAPHPRTWLLALILAFSLAGLADAVYLTAKHYTGGPVPCSITGGCEEVMTSRYATLAGLPTAGFGAAYYLAAFFLTMLYLDSRCSWTLTLLLALTAAALAVSLALLYLMAFVIRSYCQYCLLSDAITLLLFVTALIAVVQQRRARARVITFASVR